MSCGKPGLAFGWQELMIERDGHIAQIVQLRYFFLYTKSL